MWRWQLYAGQQKERPKAASTRHGTLALAVTVEGVASYGIYSLPARLLVLLRQEIG